MTKKELIEDPNSCLNKATDEMPVFLLIANDEDAADIVRFWIERKIQRYSREKRRDDSKCQAKLLDAIKIVNRMEEWIHDPSVIFTPNKGE